MSRKVVSSRAEWSTILVENEDAEQPVGSVVDQQPSEEQPKQAESPTESQDVAPEEQKADAGAAEVQGSDLEADMQEPAEPIIGPEGEDDPEVIRHGDPYPEPVEIPERAADVEDDDQEEVEIMIGGGCGDNPDIIGHAWIHTETVEMPEAGEGKPPV